MKEAGLSLAEVSGLTLYWKWLLMGYKEPRMQQVNMLENLRKMSAMMPRTPDGWKVTK